jgi:hypothetical protein
MSRGTFFPRARGCAGLPRLSLLLRFFHAAILNEHFSCTFSAYSEKPQCQNIPQSTLLVEDVPVETTRRNGYDKFCHWIYCGYSTIYCGYSTIYCRYSTIYIKNYLILKHPASALFINGGPFDRCRFS